MGDKFKDHLRSSLIAGILTLVPLGVTFFVVSFLFRKIGGGLPNLLSQFFPAGDYPLLFGPTVQTILGLLITFLIIYFTGLIVSNIIGRRLISTAEQVLTRIPIVREVYAPVKEFVNVLLNPQDSSRFQRVVSVKTPDSPFRVIGFVTGEIQEEGNSQPLLTVFVPTSPNPTTGVLLFCNTDVVYELDIKAETAMRLLISGGLVASSNMVLQQTPLGRLFSDNNLESQAET